MQFKHPVKSGELPGYAVRLIRSGICPYMMNASVYESAEGTILCYDDSGYTGLKALLSQQHKFVFPTLLRSVRCVAEGLRGLSDYLLRPVFVSCDLDCVYLDAAGRVRFTAPGTEADPCLALLSLCSRIYDEFPYTNADIILKKLKDTNSDKLMSLSDIIRTLSLWELELKK